jgi:hypothetical protein
MEAGSTFDDVALVRERGASFADDRVEFVYRSDVFVDDGLVDEGPQGLRRLQFRRIGRQKDQSHAIGHAQTRLAMPAGVVEDEHDGAVDAGLGFAREGFEQRREKRLRDAVVHIPEGLAARRRDKGGYIKPVEAVMAMRRRPLADGRPNAPRDGFQTEPVFVAGEDLDRPLRMFRGFLRNGVFEVFLNAAASSGEADFGFLGRGAWIDMPQALSASQPR